MSEYPQRGRRVLDFRAAQEIRQLLEHGWSRETIADKYGVTAQTVRRIGKGDLWARPIRCEACGELLDTYRRNGLCRECGLSRCGKCGGEKDPEIKNRWCLDCRRQHKEEFWARERRCDLCRADVTGRHDTVCERCRRRLNEIGKALRIRRTRHCAGCSRVLRVTEDHSFCWECRKQRLAARERWCNVCEAKLAPEERTYCRECQRSLDRMRHWAKKPHQPTACELDERQQREKKQAQGRRYRARKRDARTVGGQGSG